MQLLPLKQDKTSFILYLGMALFLIALTFLALYSPLSLMSDPGEGFLDLVNFKNGGHFMTHRTVSLQDLNQCMEVKTTWWTPGQWFVPYLFTLTGLPLGIATTLTILLCGVIGLAGWSTLYTRLNFSRRTVIYAILCMAFSRYFIISFQIYFGSTIIEWSLAPWFALLWLKVEDRPFVIQALILFICVMVGYFLKNSMLIFWIALIMARNASFSLRQIPVVRIILFLAVFGCAKYLFDLVLGLGGSNPMSQKTALISFWGPDALLNFQRLLFIIAAPLMSTIGLEDYIKYFLQKPGHVIMPDGAPGLVLIYLVMAFLQILLYIHLYRNRKKYTDKLVSFVLVICAVYSAFFLVSFLTGKSISSYEESRHLRSAGLFLLPFIVEYITGKGRLIVPALAVALFFYGMLSTLNKVRSVKVVSTKHRISFANMKDKTAYDSLVIASAAHDITYVQDIDMALDLPPCNVIYNQDDFINLQQIKNRPDIPVANKRMLFFFPARFTENGKRAAILDNFIPANKEKMPSIRSSVVGEWELVSVTYF